MSNLSVLPKILKLRSINQIIISNIRQLNNFSSSGAEYSSLLGKYKNESRTKRIKCSSISFLGKRLIHTHNALRKITNDDSTKSVGIDQFRAKEEKIEQDYEEQEKQKQKQNENDQSESREGHDKIQKLRSDILEASLKYVSSYGWSQEAIAHGAESINMPGVAHGMFPGGPIELIQHFYTKCNKELMEQLTNVKNGETPNPRDFAVKAIRLRLEMIVPYKNTWPQALAIMTLPQNVPTSLAQLLILVDDICYCAGDRSVDVGWYTRRIGIASIYKMVELYLLQDKSPEHQKTWEFLERRMDEGIQIQEFLSTSDQKTQKMAQALASAFQTARNILGINYDKR